MTLFYLLLITLFLYKPALIIIVILMYMIYFFVLGSKRHSEVNDLQIELKKENIILT